MQVIEPENAYYVRYKTKEELDDDAELVDCTFVEKFYHVRKFNIAQPELDEQGGLSKPWAEANAHLKLSYCETCKLLRPPRSFHCSRCDVCIELHDHHCGWIGSCIGLRNVQSFINFLVFTASHALLSFTLNLLRHLCDANPQPLFAFAQGAPINFESPTACLLAYTLLIWIMLSCFALEQIRTNADRNITGNERNRKRWNAHAENKELAMTYYDECTFGERWKHFMRKPRPASNIAELIKGDLAQSMLRSDSVENRAILKNYGINIE